MSIAIFFVLALAAAAIVAYPLLPGRRTSAPPPALSDADIRRAVDSAREKQHRSRMSCPSCGQDYEAGDRFCVQCGQELPQAVTASGPACPSCGVAIREDDRFCAKCGYTLVVEEGA